MSRPSDLNQLIDHLANWRTSDYDGTSLRDDAIAELKKRGPQVVPVLIKRLDELLTAAAERRKRIASVTATWQRWDEERRRLVAEHGPGADISSYQTIADEDLPRHSELDSLADPYQLRQGLVEALDQIGDKRATTVLIAALGDDACVPRAAAALRRLRDKRAVGPLLDALARMAPNGTVVGDLIDVILSYDVPADRAEKRFHAERSPQGRANLLRLLARHSGVPAAVFLPAIHDPFVEVRWAAVEGLLRAWRVSGAEPDPTWTDALVFLAVDPEQSVGWRAIDALEQIAQGHQAQSERSRMLSECTLTPDLVEAAIRIALRPDQPFADELPARLANLATARPDGRQALRWLIQRRPSAEVLAFALGMLPALGPNTPDATRTVRMLNGLLSHPEPAVAERAAAVLRSGDLLFTMLISDDKDAREIARTTYAALATDEDAARLDRFVSGLPLRTRLKYRRFRRR